MKKTAKRRVRIEKWDRVSRISIAVVEALETSLFLTDRPAQLPGDYGKF
jgi:hypothetical protein